MLRIARRIRFLGAVWLAGFVLAGAAMALIEYHQGMLQAEDGVRYVNSAAIGLSGYLIAYALAWIIKGRART